MFSEFLELIGASALIVTILGIFWKADDAISPEFREDLSIWLLLAKPKRNMSGAVTLSALRSVFGHSHFSIRCILMSAAISTTTVLGLWLFLFGSYVSHGLFYEYVFNPMMQGWRLLIPLLVANVVADFLSLFVTRSVLRAVSERNMSIIFGIAIDLIISALVFIIVYASVTETLNFTTGSYYWNPLQYLNMMFAPPHMWEHDDEIGEYYTVSAVLLSTFVSSLWLWFAVLGSAVNRILASQARKIELLKYMLPVEKTPIRSIGIVAFFLVLLSLAFWKTGSGMVHLIALNTLQQ